MWKIKTTKETGHSQAESHLLLKKSMEPETGKLMNNKLKGD